MRFNKEKGLNGFEWIWQGSKSLGASAQVLAGDLYGTGSGGYSTWFNLDGSDQQVQDDPARCSELLLQYHAHGATGWSNV